MKVTRINTPNKEADEQNGEKKERKKENIYLRDITSEWSSHHHDRICKAVFKNYLQDEGVQANSPPLYCTFIFILGCYFGVLFG